MMRINFNEIRRIQERHFNGIQKAGLRIQAGPSPQILLVFAPWPGLLPAFPLPAFPHGFHASAGFVCLVQT